MVVRGRSISRRAYGPLDNKAWVVQKRVLSPRTLHYGEEGILWECIECDAAESWPHGDTWDWHKDKRYRRPKEAFNFLTQANLLRQGNSETTYDDNFRQFHHAWYNLLGKYSQCALTNRDDILVAIHGVIQKIEASTGLTSVAGLWK
jgi:hypothetical protein